MTSRALCALFIPGRATRSVLAMLLVLGCEGTRREVPSLPEMGYPTCGGRALPEGDVFAARTVRSGPIMRESDVVERFEIRRRDCAWVVQVRQEWPLGTSDVEVVYDARLRPLRVWTRTTMPDAEGPLGHRDVRRYELRTRRVGLLRRTPTRELERFELLGKRPRAIIGPGRGLLSMWFRRAHLPVGGRLRESILDVREPIAIIRDSTLQRLPDQNVEGLGRVRVYTIYGREPVFADENDIVVGDMMGLRLSETLSTPLPNPLPDTGPIDAAAPL